MNAFRRRFDDLLLDFHQWLQQGNGSSGRDVQSIVKTMQTALTTKHADGVPSPFLPPDREFLIRLLANSRNAAGDDHLQLVETLQEYFRFLVESSAADPEDVYPALAVMHREVEDLNDPVRLLEDALRPECLPPVEVREREVSRAHVVIAVQPFLEWMGSGVPVTPSGALRRKDIEPVGAMLGARVRGGNSLGFFEEDIGGEETSVFQVPSMWQLSDLAAWWRALIGLELIDVDPPKSRPGSGLEQWYSEDAERSVTIKEALISAFIHHVLNAEMRPFDSDPLTASRGRDGVRQVLAFLAEVFFADVDSTVSVEDRTPRVTPEVKYFLRSLSSVNLLAGTDGEYWIPEGLKPTIGEALIRAHADHFRD